MFAATDKYFYSEKILQGISLIAAQALMCASTFFWSNGEYSVPAATCIVFSMFFWIIALQGIFSMMKDKYPLYALIGVWITVLGCISGVCFAFLGYLTNVFQISHTQYLKALSAYPFSSQLLLFSTGPLFPLSLVVAGIILAKSKSVDMATGVLLSVGAILFPVSRIPRIEWVAHIADFILYIPCICIGYKLYRQATFSPNTAAA